MNEPKIDWERIFPVREFKFYFSHVFIWILTTDRLLYTVGSLKLVSIVSEQKEKKIVFIEWH